MSLPGEASAWPNTAPRVAEHPSMRALGSALIARPVINSLGSFRLLMSASSSPRNKLEPHEAIFARHTGCAPEDDRARARPGIACGGAARRLLLFDVHERL